MKRNARILTAVLAATLLGTSSAAMAAFFAVTNTADMPDLVPGDGICNAGPPFGCTLRASIQETNALPGSDIIDVPDMTFNLTRVGAGEDLSDRGDLDIRDHLLIVGLGPMSIIDGQLADRVFDIHSVGVVPLVVTIGEMSIRRGYPGPNDGGAIRNASHLTTNNVSVHSSISELRGGGIAGVGASSFWIRSTRIEGNRAGSRDCAVPGKGGGGLYIPRTASPHVVLTDSLILKNVSCRSGGGVLADGAVRLTDVAVAGNSASPSSGFGGGIHAKVIELDRVTLETNRSWSGAGLSFRGEARILNSTISKRNLDTEQQLRIQHRRPDRIDRAGARQPRAARGEPWQSGQDAPVAGRKSGARLGWRLRLSAERSALPQPSDRRRLRYRFDGAVGNESISTIPRLRKATSGAFSCPGLRRPRMKPVEATPVYYVSVFTGFGD